MATCFPTSPRQLAAARCDWATPHRPRGRGATPPGQADARGCHRKIAPPSWRLSPADPPRPNGALSAPAVRAADSPTQPVGCKRGLLPDDCYDNVPRELGTSWKLLHAAGRSFLSSARSSLRLSCASARFCRMSCTRLRWASTPNLRSPVAARGISATVAHLRHGREQVLFCGAAASGRHTMMLCTT